MSNSIVIIDIPSIQIFFHYNIAHNVDLTICSSNIFLFSIIIIDYK